MNMNLEQLYWDVKALIDKVDCSRLWNGFQPLKFALYDEETCFFDGKYIPKTDAFLGNTAISHAGEMIAIWNVMEQTDPVVLASKMIHEMFHGFQRANRESRFPDEMDALYHYRYEDANLSLKLEENRIIVRLLERFDGELFRKLWSMRKYRHQHFPYQYHYEACVEQIEGTAQYVELEALKQLSEPHYQAQLERWKARIVEESNLIPVRIICYDIGALLLEILRENGIAFRDGFEALPFSESFLTDAAEFTDPVALTMGKAVEAYYGEVDRVIADAVAKADVVAEDDHEILGVNVYNAACHKGHIITRYFVMYGDPQQPQVAYGDFVLETREYKRLSKIYRI